MRSTHQFHSQSARTALLSSKKICILLKTNFLLGKRLTESTYVTILLYALFGFCTAILGMLSLIAKPCFLHATVFYITLLALVQVLALSIYQSRSGIYLSRYKLGIYPVSNHAVLWFLWLNEFIDLKLITLLFPISTCLAFLIYLHRLGAIYYAILIAIVYATFCLFLLIVRLITAEFEWTRTPVSIGSIALFLAMAVYSSPERNRHLIHIENSLSGQTFFISIFGVFILAWLFLYACAYYLISAEHFKEMQAQETYHEVFE